MKELRDYLETSTICTGVIAMITTDKIIAILTMISISLAIIIRVSTFIKTMKPKLKTMLADKKLDKEEIKELKQDFTDFVNGVKQDIDEHKEDK